MVNKLAFVWDIQQVDGALDHFVAQLQVLGGVSNLEQREHGLGKTMHVYWVNAVIVVAGRAVFGEKGVHIIGVTLANAVIELAVCCCLAQ
ncbi:hypothetical protein D3C71_2007800 [compost metagenome]